jgi:hypothetical protein
MALSQGDVVGPSDIGGPAKAKLLERLVTKDLVVKNGRGRYRLYNPLFREYLRNLSKDE